MKKYTQHPDCDADHPDFTIRSIPVFQDDVLDSVELLLPVGERISQLVNQRGAEARARLEAQKRVAAIRAEELLEKVVKTSPDPMIERVGGSHQQSNGRRCSPSTARSENSSRPPPTRSRSMSGTNRVVCTRALQVRQTGNFAIATMPFSPRSKRTERFVGSATIGRHTEPWKRSRKCGAGNRTLAKCWTSSKDRF